MGSFGDRFADLFAGKKQIQIAEALDVTDAAVRNYLGGRVPDAEKLQLIARVTGCDLHWLLTGEGLKFKRDETEQNVPSLEEVLDRKIREIVREELRQTPVQDLGSVDGFDLEAAVERYDDPQVIMNEWYRADGLAAPADYGIVFFRGWKAFSREEKIAALRDARKVMERTKSKK